MIDYYKEKIDTTLNALYTGGGRGQARDLLKIMLDNENIHPEDVLNDISQLLSERKRLLEQDCILPINRCNYFLEDGKSYTCSRKSILDVDTMLAMARRPPKLSTRRVYIIFGLSIKGQMIFNPGGKTL